MDPLNPETWDKKTPHPFARLSALDVGKHIEKKNGLSYLSWAYAVGVLLKEDPHANWAYGEPKMYGETMMVSCTVTAFGKPMTSYLPVMDHRNKSIPNPDAFQVNTAMQRCLVKAIALHGIGLYIYAGEDVPQESDAKPIRPVSAAMGDWAETHPEEMASLRELAASLADLVASGAAGNAFDSMQEQGLDNEQKLALWSLLDSKTRSALKKQAELSRKAA